jgi:hypothetical protein
MGVSCGGVDEHAVEIRVLTSLLLVLSTLLLLLFWCYSWWAGEALLVRGPGGALIILEGFNWCHWYWETDGVEKSSLKVGGWKRGRS